MRWGYPVLDAVGEAYTPYATPRSAPFSHRSPTLAALLNCTPFASLLGLCAAKVDHCGLFGLSNHLSLRVH